MLKIWEKSATYIRKLTVGHEHIKYFRLWEARWSWCLWSHFCQGRNRWRNFQCNALILCLSITLKQTLLVDHYYTLWCVVRNARNRFVTFQRHVLAMSVFSPCSPAKAHNESYSSSVPIAFMAHLILFHHYCSQFLNIFRAVDVILVAASLWWKFRRQEDGSTLFFFS